jgi:hypothetical protein
MVRGVLGVPLVVETIASRALVKNRGAYQDRERETIRGHFYFQSQHDSGEFFQPFYVERFVISSRADFFIVKLQISLLHHAARSQKLVYSSAFFGIERYRDVLEPCNVLQWRINSCNCGCIQTLFTVIDSKRDKVDFGSRNSFPAT